MNADNFSVTIGTKSGKAYATLGTGRDDSYSITEEWKKKPEVVQEAIDANGTISIINISHNFFFC